MMRLALSSACLALSPICAAAPVAAQIAPAAQAPTPMSPEATRVARWATASDDHRHLPFAVIDKVAARLHLFDASGQPLASVPVLIGIAPGDDATPGVGSKSLAEIGPAEKTTPAGRFLAKFGPAAGGTKMLWVDYATSVAIHPIPKDASRKDRRRERMLSETADDNRITYGCINVPAAFYTKLLRPRFLKKGGYVYILPDTKPLGMVLPLAAVSPAD
ncbi:hypothetical protein ACFSC3_06540 [Sphingomonas floccifaciens]|uniref:L,D-TPase catalytic domain-containing protein n=1 Tax=Sphingomonas floccifaciens TaxID=1844115 RepID=A0ABW4NBV5_9SPHN